MDYTKEEFKEIVNKFNVDKERYNWMYLINENVRNWERAKKKITNYPSYYNFISAREFRYWLLNSEKENFIEERFHHMHPKPTKKRKPRHPAASAFFGGIY